MNRLEKNIQHQLSAMDHDLFLDKELHPVYKFVYYCVKQRVNGAPPLKVVDWYVGSTVLPLSEDIVSKVRSQEGDIREAIAQATANNAARKELLRQEAAKKQEEIIDEWQKSGRSTGIPADSYMIVPKDIPKDS